jgi:hypothetical protein
MHVSYLHWQHCSRLHIRTYMHTYVVYACVSPALTTLFPTLQDVIMLPFASVVVKRSGTRTVYVHVCMYVYVCINVCVGLIMSPFANVEVKRSGTRTVYVYVCICMYTCMCRPHHVAVCQHPTSKPMQASKHAYAGEQAYASKQAYASLCKQVSRCKQACMHVHKFRWQFMSTYMYIFIYIYIWLRYTHTQAQAQAHTDHVYNVTYVKAIKWTRATVQPSTSPVHSVELYIYIYTHTHTNTHIYIYTHKCIRMCLTGRLLRRRGQLFNRQHRVCTLWNRRHYYAETPVYIYICVCVCVCVCATARQLSLSLSSSSSHTHTRTHTCIHIQSTSRVHTYIDT